ncbi:HAD-IA family hydrolase [Microbacterium gorillae]|uniref:HAD-IA family hydrolase n=1 Tax=Microbacterium gorillae TaxID=1231063 RepID=UPI000A8DE8EC|nr:HAD-IA family hydrolase [Microbacterium gorillae]
MVFDIGEVLSPAAGLFEGISRITQRDVSAVTPAYWAPRAAFDAGGATEEYWGDVLNRLEHPVTAEIVAELSDLDSRTWATARPEAAALVADVAAHRPVAVLSNAPHPMAAAARESAWAPHVSHWFFSAELAANKPDPSVYRAVSTATGIAPESIAFIDDREQNVAAARACGWNAHLWASDAESRAFLNGLILDLAPAGFPS